jgi:hypothetical protein
LKLKLGWFLDVYAKSSCMAIRLSICVSKNIKYQRSSKREIHLRSLVFVIFFGSTLVGQSLTSRDRLPRRLGRCLPHRLHEHSCPSRTPIRDPIVPFLSRNIIPINRHGSTRSSSGPDILLSRRTKSLGLWGTPNMDQRLFGKERYWT